MRRAGTIAIAAAVAVAIAATVVVAAPAAAERMPSTQTKDFVAASVQSDSYEIEAAQVALTESGDHDVLAFARQMIGDHGDASARLRQAAAASGIAVPPPGLGGDQQKMLAELQGLNPPEFDKAYWRQQRLAHEAALVVEQGYAATGDDANLRQVAAAMVPIVQGHLAMARRMAAQP